MRIFLHESLGDRFIRSLKQTLLSRNSSLCFVETMRDADTLVFGGIKAVNQHRPLMWGGETITLLLPSENVPEGAKSMKYVRLSTIVAAILSLTGDEQVAPACHAEGVASA